MTAGLSYATEADHASPKPRPAVFTTPLSDLIALASPVANNALTLIAPVGKAIAGDS